MKVKIFFSAFLISIILTSCTKDEEIEQFMLTTQIVPAAAGTINSINNDFEKGEEIELTATSADGYLFVGWSDVVNSEANPIIITINSDSNIVANFIKIDSDSDKVADDIDECPNTASGESVNEKGCSDNQIDEDKDGIIASSDLCSNTTSGESVDENGCSLNQKDSDNDGINDDVDQCLETIKGNEVDETGCTIVTKTFVPDDNFEQKLIDLGLDDIIDDFVLTANIKNIELLDLSLTTSDGIDLTGLEDFVSLKRLIIENTSTGTLELSEYPNLESLLLFDSQMELITVDENSNLKTLALSFANLTSLIVNNNNSLKEISTLKSVINTADITNNSKLNLIRGSDSSLYDISVVNNNALLTVDWEENDIVEPLILEDNDALENFSMKTSLQSSFPLDFSSSPKIKFVLLTGGKFGKINICENLDLESLVLTDVSIRSLDLSKNEKLNELFIEITSSPAIELKCIKVNQVQFDNIPEGWFNFTDAIYSLSCVNKW